MKEQREVKASRIDNPDEDDKNKKKPRTQQIDMQAIKAKASSKGQNSTSCNLLLTHMSDQRKTKYSKEIEDSKYEQVKKSLIQMETHIEQEKDRVYVPREAYERVFRDANHFTNIADSGYLYFFAEESGN